jgi:hypothetical protein
MSASSLREAPGEASPAVFFSVSPSDCVRRMKIPDTSLAPPFSSWLNRERLLDVSVPFGFSPRR